MGELREELRYLRTEVAKLRREVRPGGPGGLVRHLEPDEISAPEASIAAGSYTFVDEEVSTTGGQGSVHGLLATPTGAGVVVEDQGVGGQPSAALSYPRPITWPERERICDRIAHFLLRALQGDHRGASGRDEIHLSSRLWLVARSYGGQCFRPLRVFRFIDCKSLVKRGSDLGSSVFIGIPSEKEGRRIALTSGLGWPESY